MGRKTVQAVEIHRYVLDFEDIGEPSSERQTTDNGKLPSLKIGPFVPPEREACPFVPRPAVLPCPAAMPRPTRLRFFLAPSGEDNSCTFISNSTTSKINCLCGGLDRVRGLDPSAIQDPHGLLLLAFDLFHRDQMADLIQHPSNDWGVGHFHGVS